MVTMPITKRIEIVIGIPVYVISRMNFDYDENGGRKAVLVNPMHQYRVSRYGKHDCSAKNKKNGDCYGYPTLSCFMDEL